MLNGRKIWVQKSKYRSKVVVKKIGIFFPTMSMSKTDDDIY